MNIYNYDSETNEYLGTTEAKLDPMKTARTGEPSYLVPANATLEAPPGASTGYVACFENGAWTSKEDHRGEIYYDKETGNPVTINVIGAISETLTDLSPTPCSAWDGSQWAVDTIALKALSLSNKLAALAAYRYEKETAGITVNGAIIKTDEKSQAKLTGAWAKGQMNPAVVLRWKGENGWVIIGKSEIDAIAVVVSDYVEACYDNECAHSEVINSLMTAAEIDVYDITTGWPA